jgi:hypothetical protein
MRRSAVASQARPVRLGAAVLAAALLAGTVAPHVARAQLSGCMSDPVVSLSNGVQLHLYALINDSALDVQLVTFNVTVPRGTRVVLVAPGRFDPSKQDVDVSPDGNPLHYTTHTLVTTTTSGVAVTIAMHVVGPSGKVIGAASASGYAGQWITVRVHL